MKCGVKLQNDQGTLNRNRINVMKGVVFTSLIDMVTERFGIITAERLINESELESQGVYTAVGTYDFAEMKSLLATLNRITEIPVKTLLFEYGKYFFGKILSNYSHYFNHIHSTFELLTELDSFIHPEVRKLHPDAELPKFSVISQTPDSMVLLYSSKRKMHDFAHGLIMSTLDYFKEKAKVEMLELDNNEGVEIKILKN